MASVLYDPIKVQDIIGDTTGMFWFGIVISLLISVPAFGFYAMLASFHFWLQFKGITTYEYFLLRAQKARKIRQAKRAKEKKSKQSDDGDIELQETNNEHVFLENADPV